MVIGNRLVVVMHKISFSQLQRVITTDGELQTRSEAHEAETALTIAEETTLEEWCLVIYRWGWQRQYSKIVSGGILKAHPIF